MKYIIFVMAFMAFPALLIADQMNIELSNAPSRTSGGANYSGLIQAAVLSGTNNVIQTNATASVIVSGRNNDIQSSTTEETKYSVIVGGRGHKLHYDADYSIIGGGWDNDIKNNSRFGGIAAGLLNSIEHDTSYNFIGGGTSNKIDDASEYSSILGGWNNTIYTNCDGSTILGGTDAVITNNCDGSLAFGDGAQVTNTHSVVLSDGSGDYGSHGTNTFNAQFAGGYHLAGGDVSITGTNAAGVSLTATGAVDAGDVISGAAGTTNAITSGGLVDISSLLGGGGFATNYAGANVQIAWTGNVSYISADAETDPIWGGVSNLYLQNIVEDTTPQLGGNLSGGGYSITNVGYASITGTNAAGVSLTTVGNVGIGTNSPANPLHVSSINSIPLKIENTTVGGAVGMYYTTDDYSWQTKVGVPGDFLIQNITGSAVPLQMTRETLGGAIYGSSAGITINNNGSDIDFKVEGTGDTDLIHTDAANDRVGIGTASPTTTLDVAGSATVREKIYLSALDTDSWITATTNAAGIVTDYTFRVNGTNKLWSSF